MAENSLKQPSLEDQPSAEVQMTDEVQQPVEAKPVEEIPESYRRFSRWHRLEHWVFMASFTTLALTGLSQKYAQFTVSRWFINDLLGGIENARLIHHTAATVMMIVTIYHLGAVIYRVYVQRKQMSMLPGIGDLLNGWQTFLYGIGIKKFRPQQGRYTFEEKLEYWAVVWGTIVMALSGYLLWNPVTATKLLPGGLIPAAKAAHGAEAVLAVLSILIWHLYGVLVKTFNRSMYNGKLTGEQMLEEHPLELADIKAGLAVPLHDPTGEKRRRRLFWPTYLILAGLLLAGVYWFVNSETTALATISPVEGTVEVFVPLTPTPLPTRVPTATPAPISADSTSWDAGIGTLFNSKCAGCHNSSTKIGELDLTIYQGIVRGGKSGPAFVSGDSQNSKIVQIQQAGGHPGVFLPEELEMVIQWIDAGAPED